MTHIASNHRCNTAILDALAHLGGQARRTEIVELAEQLGDFTGPERAMPAPPSKPQYGTYLAYKLSWAITHLHYDGSIARVETGVWRLA